MKVKLGVVAVPTLIYDGHVTVRNPESTRIPTRMNFDNGAEVNVINQRFVLEHNFEKAVDAPLPSPKWMDGNTTFCYAAYLVDYKLQDSWGYTKSCRHIFYAITKGNASPIVLGMPAMTDKRIKLDIAERTWRFGVYAEALEVLPSQEFADALGKETAVYALLISGVGANQGQCVHALISRSGNDADASPQLPDKLKEYEDVFSTEEAGRLPSYEGRDHAIETTTEPPFGPLYNLSNTELAGLRRYLDDALAKRWIQHSTSPEGAPILFVPKKDGGLQLCVDYKGLNKVMVKNHHPLPLISETLDCLTGAKVFTKLDLKEAYHRIGI